MINDFPIADLRQKVSNVSPSFIFQGQPPSFGNVMAIKRCNFLNLVARPSANSLIDCLLWGGGVSLPHHHRTSDGRISSPTTYHNHPLRPIIWWARLTCNDPGGIGWCYKWTTLGIWVPPKTREKVFPTMSRFFVLVFNLKTLANPFRLFSTQKFFSEFILFGRCLHCPENFCCQVKRGALSHKENRTLEFCRFNPHFHFWFWFFVRHQVFMPTW